MGLFSESSEESVEETITEINEGAMENSSIHTESQLSNDMDGEDVTIETDTLSIVNETESRLVATADAEINGELSGYHMEFRREDGEWKLYAIVPSESVEDPSNPTDRDGVQ